MQKSYAPIVILGILFFIFGFVTFVNSTLIIYLKIACELNNFQSLWVAFAFYIAYFFTAIPSSWILERIGLKKGMMYGLEIMALGSLLFIPAAYFRMYGLFLTGLFIIATGLSLLQTASNPYITVVGPLESAARRISIMGICNKLAGVLAPLILGGLILSDADVFVKTLETLLPEARDIQLQELASRVIWPYLGMSLVLALLAAWIGKSSLPDLNQSQSKPNFKELWEVFRYPHLVLGAVAIFLYVGVEVIAADTIGNFAHSQGISLDYAKNFSAYTLSSMVLGYLVGVFFIPKYLSQSRALLFSALFSLIFTAMAIFSSGYVAVLSIALLGLGNALMWPAIWPLSLDGLGKYINIGSALLIMGIAGGAILPLWYGAWADRPDIGVQKAYVMMIPAYLFILYYSFRGYKLRQWR